jgi:hypothetical protein
MTDASPSRIEAEREDDARTDVKAILVIFCAIIAMAVHFMSGWTF